MMNKPAFWKVTVTRMMMLVSMLLCLNISSCNCDNPKHQDEKHINGDEGKQDPLGPDNKKMPNMLLCILPSSSTQLMGGDKEIMFFIDKMLEGGDPVDESKLTVKITVNDKDSTILYFGKAVTELSGNLDFKKIYTLTLNPKHDATEVIVELQLIYDNNLITTAEGKCTFRWSKAMNDITKQLFKAIDSGTCQEALDIVKLNQRTQIQTYSTYDGTHNAGYLLDFLHTPYREVGKSGNINDPTYESLCNEILTLPGIDVNQSISTDGDTPLGQAIQEGNLIYMKVLLNNPNARINSQASTTALHKAVSVVKSGEEGAANDEIIKWLLDNYPDMLNKQGADGNTALHIAIKHRGKDAVPILQILRQKGANTSIKNKANQTPLEFAKARYGDTNTEFQTIAEALTSPI